MPRPPRSGRRKGTKNGAGAAQPQPFSIFAGKHGRVGVRIGTKRAYASTSEVFITAEPVIVRLTADGIVVSGEGVVREEGDTIRVTA